MTNPRVVIDMEKVLCMTPGCESECWTNVIYKWTCDQCLRKGTEDAIEIGLGAQSPSLGIQKAHSPKTPEVGLVVCDLVAMDGRPLVEPN